MAQSPWVLGVSDALALAFAHPWLALAIAVAANVLLATTVWWLWRWISRRL